MWALKIVIFTLVLYFFYRQIQRIVKMDDFSLEIKNGFFLFLVFILLFLNQLFEWLKWNNTIRALSGEELNYNKQIKSYLSGVVTGFVTPNFLGNFIGRMFYFKRKSRVGITILTLYSNAAQFTASIFFGLLSVFFLGLISLNLGLSSAWLFSLTVIALICLLLGYFLIHQITQFLFRRKKWMLYFSKHFKHKKRYLTEQLGLSVVRHGIFSLQFFLMLGAFGFPLELKHLFYVWQLYFMSTLIPSLWFGKLLIRESVALWMFGAYPQYLNEVLAASVSLWVLNQGFPALIGFPFLKLSKKR